MPLLPKGTTPGGGRLKKNRFTTFGGGGGDDVGVGDEVALSIGCAGVYSGSGYRGAGREERRGLGDVSSPPSSLTSASSSPT